MVISVFNNPSAWDHNTALQTVARKVLAGNFGFASVGFFETDETERGVPEVSFGAPPGATATRL